MIHKESAFAVSRKRRNSGSCSGEVSVVPGCTTPSVSIDPAKFVFVSDKCYTPTVTSISPLNGTSDDTITIKGCASLSRKLPYTVLDTRMLPLLYNITSKYMKLFCMYS